MVRLCSKMVRVLQVSLSGLRSLPSFYIPREFSVPSLHFDSTATETEYPININDSYVESDSIEILDDSSPCPKTSIRAPSSSARPPRGKRTLGPTSEAKMKGKEDGFFQEIAGGASSEALERAKGFKSENHFIMIAMQPYYIRCYTLNITYRFIMAFTKHKAAGRHACGWR